jgi:hypothetical protein
MQQFDTGNSDSTPELRTHLQLYAHTCSRTHVHQSGIEGRRELNAIRKRAVQRTEPFGTGAKHPGPHQVNYRGRARFPGSMPHAREAALVR